MNNMILGQVLGSIFGGARQRRMGGGMGGLGGGLGGAALGGILAGALGRRGGMGGGRGMLLAMLLPYAMRWVQQNGGIGAVLKRAQDRGLARQAQSWVSTGDNQPLDVEALDDIVGREELSRLSQQLGVPPEDVKQGFAEILPEMVNQLTPDGSVQPEADDILQDSIPLIEQELRQAESTTNP